jgi:4-amino-4-deoxy-L-arabinose transferase-like glycosyltransferase
MNTRNLLPAGLIILTAVILRLWQFSSIPPALYIDEVAMVLDASLVADTGFDHHGRPWWQVIYPSYGDYKQPVYLWSAAAAMAVLGNADWVVRVPSLLAGLGTVVMAGLLAGQLFQDVADRNKRAIQLASMFVVAVSPWSILFSRSAFEGHLGQFLLAAAAYLFLKARRNKVWLAAGVAAALLSTYTYYSVRFVAPAIITLLAIHTGISSQRVKFSWVTAVSTLLLFLVLPLAVYGVGLMPLTHSPLADAATQFRLSTDSILKNEPEILLSNEYRQLTGNSPLDRLVFHRGLLTARELLINYSNQLSLRYMFLEGDSNLRHGTGRHGLFLLVFLPFFLTGLYRLVADRKIECAVLIIWWLVALLPATVPEESPHSLRSLNALMPASIIIGYGLAWFWQQKHRWQPFVKAAVGLAIVISVLSFLHYYTKIYPTVSQYAWNVVDRAASEYIALHNPLQKPVYSLSGVNKFYLWSLVYGGHRGQSIPDPVFRGFELQSYSGYSDSVSIGQLPCTSSPIIVRLTENQRQAVEQSCGQPSAAHVIPNPHGYDMVIFEY